MKIKDFDLFFLKALYLVEAGIVVTQVMNLDSLTSILFIATFPITVLLWVRGLRETITAMDVIVALTAALAVIAVLVDASANGADVGFGYLKKLIMFIMTLLLFQASYRMSVPKEFLQFLNKLVDFLTLFLIVMYFARRSQMHMLNGRTTIYLTFRFTNPNLTGLFLVCLYMLKIPRLFVREKWYEKTVHIVMAVFLMWFIFETQSRNCMLAVFLFMVVFAWLWFFAKGPFRVRRIWAIMIAVLPIIFVIVYMLVVSNQWIQDTFSFLIDEGKALDSRVKLWRSALEALSESLVTGAYYEATNGTGALQMHNSHLDVAVSYGVFVMSLLCVILYNYIFQKGRCFATKDKFIFVVGYCCAILLGIGEAAVFSGGIGIYIFASSFLLLSHVDGEEMIEVGGPR